MKLFEKVEMSDEMKLKLSCAKGKVKSGFDWVREHPMDAIFAASVALAVVNTVDGLKTSKTRRKLMKAESESKKAYADYYNRK